MYACASYNYLTTRKILTLGQKQSSTTKAWSQHLSFSSDTLAILLNVETQPSRLLWRIVFVVFININTQGPELA